MPEVAPTLDIQPRPRISKQHGFRETKRQAFVKEYIASMRLNDGKTLQQIAELAGYKPTNAATQASALLALPEIKAEIERERNAIQAKQSREQAWTLDRSTAVAIEEFERLKDRNPAVAVQYKRNLDQLHGLLIDRSEQIQVTVPASEIKGALQAALDRARARALTGTEQSRALPEIHGDGG